MRGFSLLSFAIDGFCFSTGVRMPACSMHRRLVVVVSCLGTYGRTPAAEQDGRSGVVSHTLPAAVAVDLLRPTDVVDGGGGRGPVLRGMQPGHGGRNVRDEQHVSIQPSRTRRGARQELDGLMGYGSAAGSFGTAPDAVYGVALCRGDSTGAYCSEHLGQVLDEVMNKSSSPGSPSASGRCVLHKNVSLYYDRFQLSLSDRDFVSGYGNEPEWPLNNTNLVNSSVAGRFRDHVAELLNATAADAARQPDRYGTGDSWFQEESTMVYSLLQCTRDMAPGRCLACLRRIISEMPRMLDANQFGGRVLGVRCLLRYEMASNSFFHIDNRTLHLQKQPDHATNNFSSETLLGQGGFGSVYRGQLPGGTEVAAKRLAACSGQGLLEFKNEIQLVARLQHRNLVRLVGCCIQGDQEKILVYEYMPNKSLDRFIFDNAKREVLDWPKRLHIIDGISQGLLYLHQLSTVCVVHRDLKASNILLDGEMNARISDFGIARIFGSSATESSTTRIVGTM
ncbi:hypothetical protein GUJ93_ZPchr0007g4762 [Zizania palustris]|uniref:Protein kinase domain-containing protein n=1 Tax=Zizania palustris TaxID=103762 RepID=A0A8J5VYS7_ZIZPA|nr:hypothetical protein GUJ93_ZPchr0007g4762 [Zizania palustris]